MNDKFLKIIGIVGLAVSCGVLYFGANMSTTEIASLCSKILGIVGGLLGSVLTIVGFTNKKEDDNEHV